MNQKDCCRNKASCNQGLTPAGGIRLAKFLCNATAPLYIQGGPLSEERLQAAIAAGPVAVQINWTSLLAHWVTVGGVSKNTTPGAPATYFVHDPLVENHAGKYQDLSFAEIKKYQEPDGRYFGTWNMTVYVGGSCAQLPPERNLELGPSTPRKSGDTGLSDGDKSDGKQMTHKAETSKQDSKSRNRTYPWGPSWAYVVLVFAAVAGLVACCRQNNSPSQSEQSTLLGS